MTTFSMIRAPAPRPRIAALLAALALLLGACAPTTTSTPDAGVFDTPEARRVETAAREAYHRMEIGRLRTGAYTLEPLVDVELPRGARWTVIDFGADRYTLRFTSDALPSAAWRVTPDGVQRLRIDAS